MTKFQTILLAILAAAVAGVLYKFVPERPELAGGLAALTAYLLGWAKQHPQDRAAAMDVVNTTGPAVKPEASS